MKPARAPEATTEQASEEGVDGRRGSRPGLVIADGGGPGSRDALALARALCETDEAELLIASNRLAELAEAERADLMVIGSTDRGRAGRVCLGSLGERALEGVPCAVAVAPRGFAEREAAIRAIAVGYDGSQASRVALRRAIGLGERNQASLLVLGAVEISLGLAGYETRQSKELQRTAMERHLRHALETIPEDLPARSRLLSGPPSSALVAAARDSDLLVLGSRGSYGVDTRLTLGTVGAAVIEGAACPILITPTDE